MPPFRHRPLALLVCCLYAGAQIAQAAARVDEAAGPAHGDASGKLPVSVATNLRLAVQDTPLKLRVERKMLSIVPKGLQTDVPDPLPEPTFVVADQIEGRQDERTVAEGNVELRKKDLQLLADQLTYFPLEDEVDAAGNVQLFQYENEMRGPHLRMKLSQQIGFFEEVDFKLRREVTKRFYQPELRPVVVNDSTTAITNAPMLLNVPAGYGLTATLPPRRPSEAYGHARRIDLEGENQLRLNDTTYSSCKPGDTDWYLRAREIKLDYDREVAESRDATLYFKDVPFLYTPYASFSLNQRRKSGFLSPTISLSSRSGADLTLPYYWNLAPNYDLTLYPRAMARRGFQLGTEARYLSERYNGVSRFEYMPNDRLERRNRWAYGLTHSHNFGRGLAASLNLNGVSDDYYWSDLSSRLLNTSQVQLPKQLSLTYAPGSWWSASATWLRYQTLQPNPAIPVARPYFLEPQINFYGRLPHVQRADLDLLGQYTRFSHPTQVDGARTVIYPQLSVPFIHPAASLTGKIGLHATHYQLRRQVAGQPSSIHRVMPTFSLDSTVVFERETQWLGRDHVQTLEPRLYYVYIPWRDQRRIPVFDTGLADFNFAQIFTENRFSGYDRINDANQLTAAITTRFLDASTGAERFKLMLAQRYYFKARQVLLPGEAPTKQNFSNSLMAFNGLILPKTYVDSALEYNHREGQAERFSVGARYQPDHAKVLSASYRYVRSGVNVAGVPTQVDQIDLAGQWPLSPRWYAVGRFNYSVRDKQSLETIAGLEYNAGCWSARFVVQRLSAVAGTPNTNFFFQLELNDFGSIGSNPLQLLRRSIPGYGKTNELPATGSLLTSE